MQERKRQPDGRVLVTEHRLCPICCKMINLNLEQYVQVELKEWRTLYAHKACQTKLFPSGPFRIK